MKNIIIFIFFGVISFNSWAFPIPKEGKAKFDIIRKNKIIGSHEITFLKIDNKLTLETKIDIEVKVLFIPAYKFHHTSIETWIDGSFEEIDAYTDFEDEREYFIKGIKNENFFIASGMDGELELDKKILPSNFWNINILSQKEVFDTQKGIVRKITVKKLDNEEIEISDKKIKCKKFILNASSNPKDLGPFPEYTLWYDENNNELMKFKFQNWKDKKIVTIIRKNQEES
mgnify:CR=1 FL=1